MVKSIFLVLKQGEQSLWNSKETVPFFTERKKAGRNHPAFKVFENFYCFLLSDEPFNVLLRTGATNRMSSSELHGETSISWASPPSLSFILSLSSPSCQGK
jgi:hypothetical protein